MSVEPRGYEYPHQSIRVVPFPPEFGELFTEPTGVTEDVWPTAQINYLGFYLRRLGCKAVLIEGHYIDRDFVDDVALFYSRSLRGYPNYCQRLHFFSEDLDEERWRNLLTEANHGKHTEGAQFLQSGYLGFSVIRPLPGSLIGRTVLQTFPTVSNEGHRRDFGATRDYRVHLAGFELVVRGLAFQQQDQGVSACATTALWSAIHKVAPLENLPVATPAAITQAASRYFLVGGRALPSEGLTIDQICEATRSAGLAPVVVRGLALDQARAQLHGYLSSGWPAILALQPLPGNRSDGHAVCAVGLKLGTISAQTDLRYNFRDVASCVMAVYVHDDRLGPYAVADLQSFTLPNGDIVPVLGIRWPGEPAVFETSILRAIIVPVPTKLRLTVARMRSLGVIIADAVGKFLPDLERRVDVSCQYRLSTDYQRSAFAFGLSDEGIYELASRTVLSRYLGEIQLVGPIGPLFDILLDATETQANPSVLCCVCRSGLSASARPLVTSIARRLGAVSIA
jgi:hypothetical protein